MTLQTVLLFFGGCLYGAAIGFLGQKILGSAVLTAAPKSEKEVLIYKRRITLRWWLKMLLNAVALFVLCKVPPMLVGAGLGIYIAGKIFIIRAVKKDKI